MAQGKYQRRRRRRRRVNWLGIIFWLVVLGLLITLIVFLFRGCGATNPSQQTNPPVSTGTTQTTPPPTAAPTVPPTTAGPTVPPTTAPTVPPTTAPTVPPTTAPTLPPALSEQVTAMAKSLLGKKYTYGGTGPDAFDTSGLIYYCFRECGISAPRKMSDQFAYGTAVQKDALQPGDVLFFSLENAGELEYVGIYIGDNSFIAVSSSKNAVEVKALNNYFTQRLLGARRYG